MSSPFFVGYVAAYAIEGLPIEPSGALENACKTARERFNVGVDVHMSEPGKLTVTVFERLGPEQSLLSDAVILIQEEMERWERNHVFATKS